jgi:rod shape-determining protein MreD
VILFVAAAVIALALQTGALHWFPLGQLVPDLILILSVNLGIKHHTALAAILAFAMGYATDVFSGSQLGLNAFMITLVFLLSYEASRHLQVTTDLAASVAVFFAVLIKCFGVLSLTGSFGGFFHANGGMMRMAVLQALLTALLAPFVFASLSGGKKLLRLPERQRED